MMKRLTLILMVITTSIGLYAQNEETLKITANAVEGFTGDAVANANAIILDAETKDSLFTMKRSVSMSWRGNEEPRKVVTLSCEIPKRPGKYIVEAFAEGYDTIYQDRILIKFTHENFLDHSRHWFSIPRLNNLRRYR